MMSIQKYNLAIGAAFVIMVSLGSMSYRHNAKLLESATWVERSHMTIRDIEDILTDVYNAERSIRGYLITGKDSYLKAYRDTLIELEEDLRQLKADVAYSDPQTLRMASLENLIAERVRIFDEDIRLRGLKSWDPASARNLVNRGTDLTGAIQTIVGDMENEETKLLKRRSLEEMKTAERTRYVLILGSAVALLVVVSSVYLIRQEMVRRLELERSLQISNERYQLAVEGTNEGLWDLDIVARKVYFSPGWKKILGYGDDEIRNTFDEWERLIHPEDRAGSLRKVQDYLAGQIPLFELEHRLLHKDGTYRWMLARGAVYRDGKGQPVRMAGSNTDITERKLARESALKALEAKTRFVSMVSHELRTPLTAIKEGIGVVLEGSAGAVNREQSEFLDLAKRNVDRLHHLINDVLDFSKLSSGKVAYRMQENDLNGTVREVAEVLSQVARAKGLDLSMDLDAGLPRFAFDRDKVIQVLTNLLNNALKFTSAGSVTVSTRHLPQTREARVSVRDTGAGIRSGDLERIFHEFQQVADSSFYRKPGSTGLGLVICREIVTGHGGRIWAESEFGRGSEFIFTMPLKKENGAHA